MMRSAKMNATTPPKLIPPFHSTAAKRDVADRADEAEQAHHRADERPPHLGHAPDGRRRRSAARSSTAPTPPSAPATSRPMTMSRITAAHSMTKMWEIEVTASADRSRRQMLPGAWDGSCPWRRGPPWTRPPPSAAWAGPPRGSVRAGRARNHSGQEDDHHRSADELGQCELPPEEQGEDDAELDDEIGGRDLEHHGGGEARTLAKQRPGQGHRRVGAGRRRRRRARWRWRGSGDCRRRAGVRSCCAAPGPGRPRPG